MQPMGTLYLVRHGQASFGAADYDQLSPLGTRQCHALGRWLGAQGLQFEAVLRGSLRRHVQSLSALAEGHGAVPDALEWPGLNEYDSAALVKAFHSGPMPPHDTPEGYRQHFRLLEERYAHGREHRREIETREGRYARRLVSICRREPLQFLSIPNNS